MTKIQNTNNVIAGVIPTEISAQLMVEWFNTKVDKSECQLTVSLLELADLFLEEGANEGIRGDIAFCQSIKETGWFRFGGQFAGIGATNNSPVGKGARLGVRAQIQHLKAYANNEALVNECVDPRFNLVTRGAAVNRWTGLNGRWAVPGKDYGESILKIWEEMYNFCVEVEEEGPSDWEWAQDTGLTDGTDPQGNLTREQAAVMLERLYNVQRRDAIFAHLEAAKSLLSLEDFI